MFGRTNNQAVADHKAAKKALRENQAAEIAAGVTEETETYATLNDRVLETEQNVSWWRR
jgi:phage gp36-like protein